MIKKFLGSIVVTALLCSCNEEDPTTSNETLENPTNEIKVEHGILSFPSKDFLKETVDELKQMETNEKEVRLAKFYQKGFMPLYPNFKESDIDLIQEHSARKLAKLKEQRAFKLAYVKSGKGVPTEIDEDGELVEEYDDDLISDDEFASFLNDERELIVGDSLYKFTYSGMFSVKKEDKALLDQYIKDNNIKYLAPDASTMARGVTQPAKGIKRSVPTIKEMQTPMDECSSRNSNDASPETGLVKDPMIKELSCTSGGTTPTPKPTAVDHTATLMAYMKTMEPCKTMNGFLDSGIGVFGASRKCYANFDSNYRTKTKFWKERYYLLNSVGVKVKHQKKGWTGLWRAKSTDEVGLTIKLATFSFKVPIPNFPASYAPKKLYFFEDKIFDGQAKAISYANSIYKPGYPEIPFVSDVTVTEWVNEAFGYELTVKKARELFYTGAWAVANSIVKSQKGEEVKRVTHILYTPTKVIVSYADISNRKGNTKKIVNKFDFNFGIGFKFAVDVDANGHFSTNINGLGSLAKHITLPKLYDYDEIEMDFVGVSRKGNVWKGSNLKYTDKK